MEKYETIKFNKSDLIFKSGEDSEDYFYIIKKGKIISYNNFYEKYKYYNKEGNIIGLISSIINEPYFSTIEAVEDTEVIKIKIDNILNINNKDLIDKICRYLYFILETWLSKYYIILAKNKVDLYNKDDILIMSNIYKNNGFIDAGYKMCDEYIKLFPENKDVNKVKELLKNMKAEEEPKHIEGNVYRFKKGYCLYTEINTGNHIYIIKSGKVGIYSILNSKQTVRIIYSDNYIINGYKPTLEYTPLMTTAIVLSDAVIEIIDKEELLDNFELSKTLIKMTSMKINNAVLKIKAINTNDIKSKLIIILYSIIKIETLFNKKESIYLDYKIYDIKNMLNIDADLNDISNELKHIKHIKLNDTDNSIEISNTIKYIEEYKNYIR